MFPDRSFFILYSIITSLDPLLTCSAINSIRIAFPRDLNLTFQSHAPGESNDFGSLFNREFLTNYALLVTCSFVKPRFNTVIEIAPASAIRVFDYAESLPITRNAHLAPPTTLRIILIRVLGGFYRASPPPRPLDFHAPKPRILRHARYRASNHVRRSHQLHTRQGCCALFVDTTTSLLGSRLCLQPPPR